MSILDDIHKFLETRLEEFIRSNPQLELQILDDQLQQQEQEALRLIGEYQMQAKKCQEEILAIAEDIKLWHDRAQKAQSAGKPDLAQGAKEREAVLLQKGNQIWAQMELAKQRLQETQRLLQQIKARRQELQAKINTQRQSTSDPINWRSFRDPHDELEAKFRKWETDLEIEQLKRKMGS